MIASVARKRTRWLGLAATAAVLVLAVPITAAAADPVQARKDIQAMGLDYNGQAFAKVESPRELRRLHHLREWSHEQVEQVFT